MCCPIPWKWIYTAERGFTNCSGFPPNSIRGSPFNVPVRRMIVHHQGNGCRRKKAQVMSGACDMIDHCMLSRRGTRRGRELRAWAHGSLSAEAIVGSQVHHARMPRAVSDSSMRLTREIRSLSVEFELLAFLIPLLNPGGQDRTLTFQGVAVLVVDLCPPVMPGRTQ